MTEATEKKPKFVFNCTKCGKCCAERGPVPLVMNDLVRWGQNGVVANFLPYIQFLRLPNGSLDLVLSRTDKNPYAFMGENKEGEKKEEPDLSCPLYNQETKECLSYDNRPLSCRTYPLEYTGEKYQVVDSECPGVGEGEMTKDDRKAMRQMAEQMNKELTDMRIAMPIFSQAMQPFIMKELFDAQRQYQEAMEKMTPEERAKFEEQMKNQQP